jgi:hypothetical protein
MTSTEVLASLELALTTGNNSGKGVEDGLASRPKGNVIVPRTPGFRTGAIRPYRVG